MRRETPTRRRWAVLCVLLVAASAAIAGVGTATAEARTCHSGTKFYLRSGIAGIHVRHVTCRRALRDLHRWVRHDMKGKGPHNWRCRTRVVGHEAPIEKVRCKRHRARLRFAIGG